MPPDGKLSTEEIATLEEWVLRGVPWSGVGRTKVHFLMTVNPV